MLALDTRGHKVIIGIFNDLGKMLYSKISEEPISGISSYLKSSIDSFDTHFSPSQIAVVTSPGLPSALLQSINFAKVFEK